MTLYEMIEASARLLEVDKDSDGFKEFFVDAINLAYLTVARDKWRPIKREKMSVCRGKIRVDGLSEHFVSLKGAFDKNGTRLCSRTVKDFIIVPEGCTSAFVEYYYLPPEMEEEDEPSIPSSFVDPHTYIFFALSLYCSAKKLHGEAAMWDTRYRNIIDNVKEVRTNFIMPEREWR